jgi:hypothetical protein
LFDAFQIFQNSMGHTFFEHTDDLIGAQAILDPGNPRRITLKNKQGTRITLKEKTADELWVFWIFPMVEQSQQLVCPYMMDDWEHLIAVSDRASRFIPLPPLRIVQPRMDDVRQLAIKKTLSD